MSVRWGGGVGVVGLVGGGIVLVVVVAIVVKASPESDIGRIPLDWIRGREIAGLNAYFTGVSAITDARPMLAISAGLVRVLAAGCRRRNGPRWLGRARPRLPRGRVRVRRWPSNHRRQ